MKFIYCLSLLFILFSNATAQQAVEPGYILEHNQDTVKGYIESGMETELTQSVKFKKDEKAVAQEYGPSDLSGFGIGKVIYQSIRFQNTVNKTNVKAFLKQLVTGEYDLFSYATPDRKFYLLRKDSSFDFIYDRVTTPGGEIVEEGNYLNILHFISVNCDKISNIYDRVGFNDQEMTSFVLKVDNCLSGGKAISFYEKPKTRMLPYIFIGGLPISGKNQFTANFTLRFTTPRIDKKTSVNVGLNYSNTTVQTQERSDYYVPYTMDTHNQIFSVPVTFQYNFTSTLIQPYFYAGFSGAYISKTATSYTTGLDPSSNQFGLALVVGIGVEAKIISKLYFKADWRFEVIMQYPAIGLSYQF
jgi:outer membrane protein W